MHLLKTDTYELVQVESTFAETPDYAILSHRWFNDEIKFKGFWSTEVRDADQLDPHSPRRASADKIRGACFISRSQGLQYIWIDTVCIDKDSSEELRTALNTMFAWYHEAAVCYTYLSDIDSSAVGRDMKSSVWFSRGWTLQELLAPRRMEFYDGNWSPMGTRNRLASTVGEAAGIDPKYLEDAGSELMKFREATVATKMSWMAGRTTRMVEDIAYSMLGIFNVNMMPQYGEGVKAFARLQEALILESTSFDESLFAWTYSPTRELRCFRKFKNQKEQIPQTIEERCGLLAPSPDCFISSTDLIVDPKLVVARIAGGFQRTQAGITFMVPTVDTNSRFNHALKKSVAVPLNCWRRDEKGQLVTTMLELSRESDGIYTRAGSHQLQHKKGAKVGVMKVSFGIRYNAHASSLYMNPITVVQPQVQLRYP